MDGKVIYPIFNLKKTYFLIFLLILFLGSSFAIIFGKQILNNYEKKLSAEISQNLLNEKSSANINNQNEKETILLFVGDIMLSRGIAYQIKKHNDPRYPFLNIASFLRSADVIFGNLEGPISNRGRNQGSIYSFRAKPEVIEGLEFAGFNILSLANNHSLDWGREALEDTITIARDSGIKTIGAGRNYSEANSPIIWKSDLQKLRNIEEVGLPEINLEVEPLKIAFLAYTNLYPETLKAKENSIGISSFDLEKTAKELNRLKETKEADIVIISFHWGEEYKTRSNLTQQKIAHALIEAGADLIVGHHPHVVQEIEKYRNGWIAYSLGNFVFDQNFSKETSEGLILKAVIKGKAIEKIEEIKIKFSKTFQPEIAEL